MPILQIYFVYMSVCPSGYLSVVLTVCPSACPSLKNVSIDICIYIQKKYVYGKKLK